MPPVSRHGLSAAAFVAALVLSVPLAAHAQDLEGARDTAARIGRDLADVTQRYEQVWAEVELAREELERLDTLASGLEADARRYDAQLRDRAREIFKRGSASSLELLLASGEPGIAIERASLVAAVQVRDTVGVEEALAARLVLAQTVALAEQRRGDLEVLQVELASLQERLEVELEVAEQRVSALEVIAARQRRIDRGGQSGVYACPLDRHLTHFVDSWGAPRSGGRRHKGTDIMGPMGAPVYAITSGTVARHSNSRLGGISLYLRGDDGSTYFYTHLQGYAPRGAVGSRVQAGDHIAYNGNTGNARGGAPHIHFERMPGGGSSVNPYPYLAAACF